MPLAAGDTLSHYRITAAIGAGGMGEVYRATDTKLGREVALKLLPEAFAADPERLARFEREAKLLASLNHSGIAHLYGFDAVTLADRTRAHVLVMELVEGEDLAERLKRGAIPVDEALGIARQIAEAIEEAHEKGVVHRDLKPANVKLTPDGKVKVLDFGLAKAWTGEGAGATSSDLSQSPTLAHTGTAAGLILGTAAYMSPEQARGKRADKRADIWAFGVVLWEMLTGQRLFAGETVSDVLAGVLKTEPDWGALPDSTPEAVRGLLRRCLERAPLARLRDIGEARVLLSGRLQPPQAGAQVATARRPSPLRLALPWLLCAAAVVAALAVGRQPAPTRLQGPQTIRLTIAGPGPEYSMDISGRPVLSADGRTLAMALWGPEGNALFVRPLDSFELVQIEGGGRQPLFSPDGRALAFTRFGTIWKVDLTERKPSLVGRLNEDVWDIGFAAWHPDGRLLIPGAAGLWSLPASGGDATLLVAADLAAKEGIQAVSVLPDGRLVLTVLTQGSVRVEIRAADASGPRVVAAPAAGEVSERATRDADRGGVVGDVLFTLRSGQWRATRLDLRRLEPIGPAVSLPDMPGESLLGPSLAWFPGSTSLLRELVWVSRTGVATSLGMAPAYFRWPRLSPDARRLALGSSRDRAAGGSLEGGTLTGVQVGVVDLQTGGRTWLDGFGEPVWTADGRRVVTSLGPQPFAGLGEQVADASRPIETIFKLEAGVAWPTSASRDGAWLVYYGKVPDGDSNPAARDLSDIFVLDRRTGQRQRHSLPGYQRGGRLSPDASWLAYQTTDGARSDIRVRAFPALDADYTVSTDGGQEPAWSADGKELYYRRGPDMMRVKVPARGETVIWPPPEVLFTGNYAHDFFGDQSYDVAPDGRFLMLRPLAKEGVEIHVVLGWMAEVEARLRSAK